MRPAHRTVFDWIRDAFISFCGIEGVFIFYLQFRSGLSTKTVRAFVRGQKLKDQNEKIVRHAGPCQLVSHHKIIGGFAG